MNITKWVSFIFSEMFFQSAKNIGVHVGSACEQSPRAQATGEPAADVSATIFLTFNETSKLILSQSHFKGSADSARPLESNHSLRNSLLRNNLHLGNVRLVS